MVLTGSGMPGVPVVFQGVLKIIAGLFMVIMGVNLLGIFPVLRKVRLAVPASVTRFVGKRRLDEKRPFFIGLLNGLMPCGPLQSMQIIALGSGNPIAGGLSMLMFSLGTVPLMLGLGTFVSVAGKKYNRVIMQVGAVLVVVLGLSMFSQGRNLTGGFRPITAAVATENSENTPTAQESQETQEIQVEAEAPKEGSDEIVLSEQGDVQYISSVLENGRYPEITVYSNKPVVWTIQAPAEALTGCNYRMVFNEYGITHELTPGENVIEFTPGDAGTVQYTCWMGMINGKINIIDM